MKAFEEIPPGWYSTEQIRSATGCSASALKTWEKRGIIPRCRVLRRGCGRMAIWPAEVMAIARERFRAPTEAARESISLQWAWNPPPGAEEWSDDVWERKIDEAACKKSGLPIESFSNPSNTA